MSADTNDEATPEVDEAPAWVAPVGHTTLLDASIIDAAATPIAWDHDLPADGIVEHNSPGEYVDSMQYQSGPGDDDAQGAAAAAAETESTPPAKKAPAKKAPAKKAPAKAPGAKAAK